MSKNGQMEVWIIRAKLFRNTKCMGKMSPYVNVQVGKKCLKSAVAKEGGYDPTWSDVFTCSIPEYKHIELAVMDRSFFRNYVIGTGTIETNEIIVQGRIDRDIRIYHKNKEAGFIRIVISCIRDCSPQLQSKVELPVEQHQQPEPQTVAEVENDEFRLIDDANSTPSKDSPQTSEEQPLVTGSSASSKTSSTPKEDEFNDAKEKMNGVHLSGNCNECVSDDDPDSTCSTLPMLPDPTETY